MRIYRKNLPISITLKQKMYSGMIGNFKTAKSCAIAIIVFLVCVFLASECDSACWCGVSTYPYDYGYMGPDGQVVGIPVPACPGASVDTYPVRYSYQRQNVVFLEYLGSIYPYPGFNPDCPDPSTFVPDESSINGIKPTEVICPDPCSGCNISPWCESHTYFFTEALDVTYNGCTYRFLADSSVTFLFADADGDGYTMCYGDCNDSDPAVNPGAQEVCDGKDNNCDGQTDGGCCYNNDNDGYSTCNGDCNDNDATINPGAQEVCDGKDNNCDGLKDDTCVGDDEDCSKKSNSTNMGSSANLASGNLYHSQQVLGSHGSGLAANITLSYNSLDTTIGPLGRGWTHNYDINITDDGYYKLVLKEQDGKRIYFYTTNGYIYYPDFSDKYSSIIKNFSGYYFLNYTLTEKTGMTYTFNLNGKLDYILDKNYNILMFTYAGDDLVAINDSSGRETTLMYDLNYRIVSIIDAAGRTTTFTYNSDFLSTITDPLGGIWAYTYDADGRMLTKTDPLGRTTTYIYDTNGKLTSSQDPSGNIKSISYDQTNKTAYITEKNGAQWISVYDNILNVPVQITDPDLNVTTYTYDSNRNLLSKSGPGSCGSCGGSETTYTYDTDGNMLTKTEAYGTANQRTTSYTYNEFGQVLTVRDPDGNTTTYTYAAYNLLDEVDNQGNITSHTYGSQGERLSTTDPNGNITTFTYDQYGNLASTTNALNQTTTYTYDIMGNLLSMTDANGNTTTYQYDLRDRLIREIKPDGGIIDYEYDLASNRTAIIDANGNRTTYTYDSINRLIKTTDPEGNSTNYTYDSEGNMTSMTIKDSSNNVLTSETYTYDIYNRLTRTTHADSTYTEQTYDALGNVTSKRDENGNVTTFTYDALNRLTSVTDPNTKVTSYTYDKRNNLKTVTDANNNITTYNYDSVNHLISTASPDTGTTTYTYDPNGNMTSKTDASNVTTTHVYDALNRQITIQFPDTTQNINYYYDDPQMQNGKGRLTAMTDLSGTTWYDYDKMGRVVMETKQINGLNYRTEYSYDLNGNISTITYPGGRKITYMYNALNKINSVTEIYLRVTRTLASNIIYQPFGDITSMMYGNGIVTTKTYNNRYQLSNLNIGAIKQLSYSRDNIGNITAIADNLNPNNTKSYTYDNLYRLTLATGLWGAITYAYDSVGNRTYETTDTGNTTYTYTTNTNKLASTSGEKVFNFNFDNNGNTTSENTRQFIYNQNQRLTQVTDTGTVLGEYVYNGNGQRVKKTVNGQTTIFHYDQNGLLITESTRTGNIKAEYVYLNGQPLAKINTTVSGAAYNYPDPVGSPGFRASLSLNVSASSLGTSWLKYSFKRMFLSNTSISEISVTGGTTTVTGIGTVKNVISGVSETISRCTFIATITDGSPDAMGIEIRKPDGTLYYSAGSQTISSGNYTIGSNIYYYHDDHLGTPMTMTNSSGSVVWGREYLPFSEALSITGSVTNNLRFPGQYYDSETGLHQNGFRDYKPEIGRYPEADPIGLLGGINLYIYVGNDPVNWVDPWGLYGSGSCTYYEQACAANGGAYECGLAQKMCPTFPTGNEMAGNTSDCIRQCLQERHKNRMSDKDTCSDRNNIDPLENTYDHAACMAGCTANSENPYNPFGPDLPDNDITIY